ncbi:retrovirus-related pol polyprotein from transposon TNT 1-94, partial [Trifolium medium]|nr:retrovirus-related pol polyprotein from transposon TNT 1-94 [Trifolium medium]
TPAIAPSSSSKNIFKAFAQHITIKLDESNFLSWKQQVEGIIRTHKLHRHLVNPTIPPRYLSVADNAANRENPAYTEWEEKYSLLFTWLLTTLSDSVLPRVVRCVQAHEVWSAIDVFYRTQITAKSRELRSELKSITKDHMEAILEGLPEEYNALSTVIQYRESDGPCPVLVAEAMLLSHESRLERMKKAPIPDLVSVNVTQASSDVSSQSSQSSQASSLPNESFANSYGNRGGRGGRGGRNGGRGGRSGGRGKVQCQICQKFGHDATVCYHRFAAQPTAAQSLRAPSRGGYPPRPPPPHQHFYPRQPQAYLTGADSHFAGPSSSQWYPDSGATHHVTNSPEHFIDSSSFSGSDQVML